MWMKKCESDTGTYVWRTLEKNKILELEILYNNLFSPVLPPRSHLHLPPQSLQRPADRKSVKSRVVIFSFISTFSYYLLIYFIFMCSSSSNWVTCLALKVYWAPYVYSHSALHKAHWRPTQEDVCLEQFNKNINVSHKLKCIWFSAAYSYKYG